MYKLVYAKTPNPTEDVSRDHYFNEELKNVLDFVKGDDDMTSYVNRYVDCKKVK